MATKATVARRRAALAQALARRHRVSGPVHRRRALGQAYTRTAGKLDVWTIGRARKGNPRAARVARTNPKRKAPKMARRRTAAQRAAFRKMIAGLKRSKRTKARRANPTRKRRRRPVRVAARRRNPRRARTVLVLRNPRRKGTHMARRRRRRARRAARVIMVNPRRKRHVRRRRNPRRFTAARRHFRRRRNPGIGGGLALFAKTGIPAVLAGGTAGFVEAQFLGKSSALVQVGAKLGIAAGLGLLTRKHPMLSVSLMAGVLGTLGFEQGVKMGGGVVAMSAAGGAKQTALLVRHDPQAMGLLVRSIQGMGRGGHGHGMRSIGAQRLDESVSLSGNELASTALPANRLVSDVELG